MINVIGHKIIQEDILAEIREAKFHVVIADEVTSHNDKIMSICIRFVEKNKNIREEFLEFIPLERITGEQLAKELVTFYEYSNLDMQGNANMSSRKKGLVEGS